VARAAVCGAKAAARALRKAPAQAASRLPALPQHARLSTGARQIIQRAALTGALLEDLETRCLAGEPIDAAQYATLSNAQRRLFETVGLRRVPRDVPQLQEYLANKAGAAPTDGFVEPSSLSPSLPKRGPEPSCEAGTA
jgi:hypothetical protein